MTLSEEIKRDRPYWLEGWKQGRSGKGNEYDNPYRVLETVEHSAWRRGFLAGRRELLDHAARRVSRISDLPDDD